MLDQQLIPSKVIYILGRFPVLSETFVQQEILELERQGVHIQIFSLFKLPKTREVEVLWEGKATYTCVSQYSWLFLLRNTIKYFFQSPLRFTRVFVIMLGHYRLRSLIGCRVLLFASFLATVFDHEDIIHMHAHFASESASVAQFTHLLTDIPYSFTAHANDIYLSSKAALAFKMRMARFIITISAYNKTYLTQLVDHNVARRIHCIYNGVNLHDFPSKSVTPAAQSTPLILSVCRLVEKKGLPDLLQACRILRDRGYNFSCSIVGDGPQRQDLEQQIRELGLSDKIMLLGAQTHQQVREIYQKAAIMALPCIITKNGDRDGIPTVLIESLCMGIPTVSTAVSGISELITSEIDGLLVPPHDSRALASAIARFLDDPSLISRVVVNGRKNVEIRFNLHRNVRDLIQLFCQDKKDGSFFAIV